MMRINEFRQEVIEALCELGGCSEAEANALSEEKRSDIEYAHTYRLSPAIIAGAILGINDCCLSPVQNKS